MSWPLTWQGFDVLTLEPDRRGPIDDQFERRFDLVEPDPGLRWADVRGAAPAPVRAFTWTANGRSAVEALRSWLAARRGRLVLFWMPTWQEDLVLAADVSSGASSLVIKWSGYTARMFAAGGMRRHVALWRPGFDATYHRITGATDPGGNTTETLTISPATGSAWPATSSVVSFLRLCRLDTDLVRLEWHGQLSASATLPVREVPLEAPE